jgi:hypothetical protein
MRSVSREGRSKANPTQGFDDLLDCSAICRVQISHLRLVNQLAIPHVPGILDKLPLQDELVVSAAGRL